MKWFFVSICSVVVLLGILNKHAYPYLDNEDNEDNKTSFMESTLLTINKELKEGDIFIPICVNPHQCFEYPIWLKFEKHRGKVINSNLVDPVISALESVKNKNTNRIFLLVRPSLQPSEIFTALAPGIFETKNNSQIFLFTG